MRRRSSRCNARASTVTRSTASYPLVIPLELLLLLVLLPTEVFEE